MEPYVKVPCVKNSPTSFNLGPYTFFRDEMGEWSRNRINPGTGMKEFALEPCEVFLCEEIIRQREEILILKNI